MSGNLGLLLEGDEGGQATATFSAPASPGLMSEMEREALDRQRARRAASAWLRDVLPGIAPRGVTFGVVGPTECGPELLGIEATPATGGRIVVTTVAFRDGRTRPSDPAPAWLSAGLMASQSGGKRLLGVSRAGTFYGRL
jgi:hypothetical protein